jgi:hypothetical protein
MLILAQIDDRSGEVLGHALEELMTLGARDVQLLSSVTKKGRPGYVLLVDLDAGLGSAVAAYLATELGVWGFHVLEADHRHFEMVFEERIMTVACGARSQTFSLPCKFFFHEGELLRVKVERSDVEAVQRFVRETGKACSTDAIRSRLEHEVRTNPTTPELRVQW